MILRPRQEVFVENCLTALKEHGAAIGVAPTGAGKTVMLSAVARKYKRPLILQHRDELVSQNRSTFMKLNPGTRTDLFVADRKAWSPGATFAMIQTLFNHHESIPEGLDLLIADECHHIASRSYQTVISAFKERNPDAHVFGVTATPQRSDKKALVGTFPVVADVIQLGELVQGGFLVRPRGYTIDLGIKAQIDRIPRTSDFDMDEVEKVMDHRPINEQVVREWKREAGDRQTVVFCSTVAHAEHLCEVFVENGIRAITIDGKMGKRDRKDIIDAFDAGRYQVILNCMVLTEGWDCQPVSCVVLMRPCSAKGPMLQMVGRGLRKLDQNRYPGQVKSDCKILDFGYSLVSHGDLETHINLAPQQRETGEAQLKQCPGCGIEVPNRTMECPVCGYEWQSKEKTVEHFEDIRLTEIQLMDASPFRWEEFFDGMVWLANGMAAWASVIEFGGAFWAVGGTESQKGVTVIDRTTEKVAAVASADDFLRQHGDTSLCKKTRSWLSLPPTDKQLQMLPGKNAFSMSRYTASCLLTWKFNESKIKVALTSRN